MQLLERMLDLDPAARPSCADVLRVVAAGPEPELDEGAPLLRRRRLSLPLPLPLPLPPSPSPSPSRSPQSSSGSRSAPLAAFARVDRRSTAAVLLALAKVASLDMWAPQASVTVRYVVLGCALADVCASGSASAVSWALGVVHVAVLVHQMMS